MFWLLIVGCVIVITAPTIWLTVTDAPAPVGPILRTEVFRAQYSEEGWPGYLIYTTDGIFKCIGENRTIFSYNSSIEKPVAVIERVLYESYRGSDYATGAELIVRAEIIFKNETQMNHYFEHP